MADPKYANLPGIAHDQPDVYETTDLPECDLQSHVDIDEDSNAVETLHITTGDAFGRFKGKQLAGEVYSSEYELAATGSGKTGEKETPLQKYQRLNCEVRELLDELDLARKAESDGSGGNPAQSLASVARQTAQLQEQLSKLKLEETLGSDLVKQLEDPRGAAKERLLVQLNALKDVSGVVHQPQSKNSERPYATRRCI